MNHSDIDNRQHDEATNPNRWEFISGVGRAATGVVLTTGGGGTSALMALHPKEAKASAGWELDGEHNADLKDGYKRQNLAFQIRNSAAITEKQRRVVHHRNNGDEDRYPSRIGNFSKTLPHDLTTGEVDPAALKDGHKRQNLAFQIRNSVAIAEK